MALESFMFSEINQAQKVRHYVFSHMKKLEKRREKRCRCVCFMETEGRLVEQRKGIEERRNGEVLGKETDKIIIILFVCTDM